MSFANQLEQLINDHAAFVRNNPEGMRAAIAATLENSTAPIQVQGASLLLLIATGKLTGVSFGEQIRAARSLFETLAANTSDTLSPPPDLSTMGVQSVGGKEPASPSGRGTGASITKVNTDLNQDDRLR